MYVWQTVAVLQCALALQRDQFLFGMTSKLLVCMSPVQKGLPSCSDFGLQSQTQCTFTVITSSCCDEKVLHEAHWVCYDDQNAHECLHCEAGPYPQ